jgi:hypothetical protein
LVDIRGKRERGLCGVSSAQRETQRERENCVREKERERGQAEEEYEEED